jgi:tetratricopeptide (TPR) repeat protein
MVSYRSAYLKIFLAAGLFLVLAGMFSCSTKKDTFTRRLYHNITSRYNVYFNGKESLNEGAIELVKGVKDNYSKVLPVFNFGTKQEAQQLNPKMDRAIQKASITIQKHSMPFDGVEKVRWIDDAYLLIGKAYFYKQEYFSARRTFNFIVQEYGYNDMKYQAMIWLALTYNQTQEFEKSEPLLNLITSDVSKGMVPKSVTEALPQVYADLYIRQEYYDKAVEYLFEAIAYNPQRDLKTRMMFILAQIFQRNEDLIRATEWYGNVISRNPQYDMAFQAKINLAKSYDAKSGDRKQITKILSRMLRDDKNKDYRDQIYFALADVALRDGDTIGGIDYLRQSVSTSVNNNYQRAQSSLQLADIYFKIPDYEEAQAYYDTAMMFIPKDYPNYNQIELKTRVLTDLVANLITIQVEDSLQRVANLPESEQNAIIDNLIKIYQEEQELLAQQKELEAALAAQQQATSSVGASTAGIPLGGKWYFYNVPTKESGYSEFLKKWGKRKYEDLWRISNKQVIDFGGDDMEMEADTTQSDSLVAAANDPYQRPFYLKNLPVTEEDFQASDKKILDAYFGMGRIYRDGLRDYPQSNQALETMNTRFPASEHELQSFYYLYRNYSDLGNHDLAADYKSRIIALYPESDYAKVLDDPDYFNKLAKEKSKVVVLYEDTYKAYEAGQYYQVIAKSDMALSLYGDTNDLAPRFEYLRAVSIGKVDVIDSLVSNLKRIILKYPNSEIKTLSQSILAHIVTENPEFKDENFVLPGEVPAEKPSPYKPNPSMQHMFMLVADSREIKLNPFKVKLSDYNQKFFSLEKLNINSLVLDNQHYLITVGNFNNMQKAKEYMEALALSEYVYADLIEGTYYNFVISTENYPVFFKEKNIGEYEKFFNKYYK